MNWPAAFAIAAGAGAVAWLFVTALKQAAQTDIAQIRRTVPAPQGWTVTTKTPVSLVDTATLERDLALIMTEIAIAELPPEDVPETIASELVDKGYQLIKVKKGKTA